MEIVIPVSVYARMIVDASTHYVQAKAGRGVIREPIELKTAGLIANALVDEALNRKMHWVQFKTHAEDEVAKLIPAYGDVVGCRSALHTTFFHDVFGDVQAIIDHFIGEIIGSEQWRIWTLKPISVKYLRYTHDVQARYPQNVFKTEPNGMKSIMVGMDNSIYAVLLHRAGDPIFDRHGKPVLVHKRGDIIRDERTGSPIVDESATAIADMTLVKGEDYRIYEWERLLREKAVEYPHFTADEYELFAQNPLGTSHIVLTKKDTSEVLKGSALARKNLSNRKDVVKGNGVPNKKSPHTAEEL